MRQKIDFKNSDYKGNAFKTASGNFDVKIFNLKTSDTVAFSVHENGAGGSETTAQENLEEKFMLQFQSKFKKTQPCKR